jgi:hypothetical protein
LLRRAAELYGTLQTVDLGSLLLFGGGERFSVRVRGDGDRVWTGGEPRFFASGRADGPRRGDPMPEDELCGLANADGLYGDSMPGNLTGIGSGIGSVDGLSTVASLSVFGGRIRVDGTMAGIGSAREGGEVEILTFHGQRRCTVMQMQQSSQSMLRRFCSGMLH